MAIFNIGWLAMDAHAFTHACTHTHTHTSFLSAKEARFTLNLTCDFSVMMYVLEADDYIIIGRLTLTKTNYGYSMISFQGTIPRTRLCLYCTNHSYLSHILAYISIYWQYSGQSPKVLVFFIYYYVRIGLQPANLCLIVTLLSMEQC